ncbi:unnamed protein product [Peronospora belbahrii]|uniref:Reverse transcriptase Ty1/copia-type domain-containing protein n=1 Tax=Peronospora belbahrii TaxID=622444 RepID=A0AAU9L318_9STRA|nr:unnamed protein product [Peronospora belbahrii]
MFIHKGDDSTITLVGVYVDDLLVSAKMVCNVSKFFSDMKVLKAKDLGEMFKLLGRIPRMLGTFWSKLNAFALGDSARMLIGEEQKRRR